MCRRDCCCDGLKLFSALTVLIVIGPATYATQHAVVAVVSSSLNLTCNTRKQSYVRWDFTPADSTQMVQMYNGASLLGRYTVDYRYLVHNDTVTGESILEINNIQSNDSGKYTCFVPPSRSAVNEFHVVVLLDSNQHCSPIRGNYTPENDKRDVQVISCVITFSGSLRPAFQCHVELGDDASCKIGDRKDASDNSLKFSECTQLNKSASRQSGILLRREVCSFEIPVDSSLNGCKIACGTNFTLVDHNEKNINKTDTLVFGSAVWSFSQNLNILFGPESVKIDSTANEAVVKHGDVLTCTANSNPASTYEWIDLMTGSRLHNGSQFVFNVCRVDVSPSHMIEHAALQCIASANGRTVTDNSTFRISGLDNVRSNHCLHKNSPPQDALEHVGDPVLWAAFFAAGCTSILVVFLVAICCLVGGRSRSSFSHKVEEVERIFAVQQHADEVADVVFELHEISQAVHDEEPIPPPLPKYQPHIGEPPTSSVSRAERRNDYVECVGQEDVMSPPTEEPTTSDDLVIYAELAVNIRAERVRRAISAVNNNSVSRGSTAVYASIDHRILTTTTNKKHGKRRLQRNKKQRSM